MNKPAYIAPPLAVRIRLTLKAAWVICWGLVLRAWHWRPGRRPEKPKTPEEIWNENVGQPVQPAEVMLFAKPKCRDCFGSGKVTHAITRDGETVQGIPYKKGERIQGLCACGINKFVRLHKDELIQVKHQLFWRPKVAGTAPTRGDATRIRAMLETGQLPVTIPGAALDSKK
jgi:hypothetical protein